MNASEQPRKPPQPCPPHKVAGRNTKQTFRELLTADETKTYLIGVLKNLARTRPKGPWRDYMEFYTANQSGDTESFKPETKLYVQKMLKDLAKEYAKQQGEDDATEKE